MALVIGGLFLPRIINWLHPLGNRDWQEMGQRGDLYGGFMNPILSFLAFMGVLYSIYLQRLDLRETQQESQRQQFEATFFQLLAQQNRLVEAIDLRNSDHGETSRGRDCFHTFVNDIEDRYQRIRGSMQNDVKREMATAYRGFWNKRRQDLGHYFRFLYNFVRYVDESDLPQLPTDKIDPKIKYMRILRSQLSDYELVLIFYNAHGGHGEKLNNYVGKYHILDNLQSELVRIVDAIEFREGLGRIGNLPVRAAL